jgi:predicted permease
MLLVLQRLSTFYIFLLLGWILGKGKKELVSQTGVISFLLVNLLLPCKVFANFSKNFTTEYFLHNGTALIFSLALLIILHLLCRFPAKALSEDSFERKVYEYSVVISNYAYLGYPLAEAIFGSQGLTDLVLFCIPFAVYTNTYGYVKLSGGEMSVKKLFNPITLSILLGAVFGLLQIPLPSVIAQPISSASACVGPLSMLLTGLTLSTMTPKALVRDGKAYLFVVLRLLVIPAVIFGLCKLFSFDGILAPALFMAAMPTGLNPIIFAKNAGQSPELGAKLAFLSHLFSILTLPLWLMLV